jgi:hypothetical protein
MQPVVVDASGTTTAAMAEAHSNERAMTTQGLAQHENRPSCKGVTSRMVYPTCSKFEVGGAELDTAACLVVMETGGKDPVPSMTTKLPGTYARSRWRTSGWT